MMNKTEKSPELVAEIEKTIRAWGAITIQKLRQSIRDNNMSTKHLYKSFKLNIQYNQGFPSEVIISFPYHGRFVDMGVGNGVKISDVKSNAARWKALKRSERKGLRPRLAKKWYSPVVYAELNILSVLLLRKYGLQAGSIREVFDSNPTIKMKF